MKFYIIIFVTNVIFFNNIITDSNLDLLLNTDLEKPSPLSVGLVFLININNTSPEVDYVLKITPDKCCLNDDVDYDCDYFNILNGCYGFIPKGKAKTLRVVAPLLDVFDRNGHCNVFVDSKSNNDPTKRDVLRINFNTAIDNNRNMKHCRNKDEDPFNDCKPVYCDTYYNGHKTYFSRKHKRCINLLPCIADDEEYPTVIYNPVKYNEEINNNHLEAKKLKRRKGHRKAKDVLIISKFEPNVTGFINTVDLLDNIIGVTTSKAIKDRICTRKYKDYCLKSWETYFLYNRWPLIAFASVITIQCFLICTMFYCLSKSCNCCKDKKVVRKFFNYRQDVSVTTPLIGTSNMDTETDYQNASDVSNNINNVEQKMKCYKACQKENLKTSLSDDILSKCLNRRDWKKFKSEATTEVNKDDDILDLNAKKIDVEKGECDERHCETKVAFEDEVINKNKAKTVSIVNFEVTQQEDDVAPARVNSEKEIKCHSYDCFGAEVKTNRNKCFNETKTGAKSVSTEKGAQAYFSNDSIDDFLSERGVTYLAGENISKYTFSTEYDDLKPPASTVSSKTSKNFVRNVLSLLRKKSKLGTSSDPGPNDDVDVKLIHMSKASVYTSSNDSEYMKTLKRNDSRTSF